MHYFVCTVNAKAKKYCSRYFYITEMHCTYHASNIQYCMVLNKPLIYKSRIKCHLSMACSDGKILCIEAPYMESLIKFKHDRLVTRPWHESFDTNFSVSHIPLCRSLQWTLTSANVTKFDTVILIQFIGNEIHDYYCHIM